MQRETLFTSAGKKGHFRGVALSLAILLLIAFGFAPAQAARSGKAGIAPDLAQQMQTGSPAPPTRLIVQLKGADLAYVTKRIQELGGTPQRHYRNIEQMVADVPLEAIGALAEVEGVDYISPDREVKSVASHLEITTGAALASSIQVFADGQLQPLDGTGVTVAVLDSG
ncbi:MAG TPA: hypothetical protein VN898_15740, partial [Candidatus Binatia bacterium]|nr:hypothetical protein [Candidatus Binatia bacterium]